MYLAICQHSTMSTLTIQPLRMRESKNNAFPDLVVLLIGTEERNALLGAGILLSIHYFFIYQDCTLNVTYWPLHSNTHVVYLQLPCLWVLYTKRLWIVKLVVLWRWSMSEILLFHWNAGLVAMRSYIALVHFFPLFCFKYLSLNSI